MKLGFLRFAAAVAWAVATGLCTAQALIPTSYSAGYNGIANTFDFVLSFDRQPEFTFDANGQATSDDLRYWMNSVYGVNAYHTALETYVPGLPLLGITTMLLPTSPGQFSLIRIDGTSPEIYGWRGVFVARVAYTLSNDYKLRFSVNQADVGDDDGGISTIFETYRPGGPPSGMYILQVPEPAKLQIWIVGLLFLTVSGFLRRLRTGAPAEPCGVMPS